MLTRFYAIDPLKLQDTIGNILALEVGIGNIMETQETIDDDMNIMTVQELDDFMNQGWEKKFGRFSFSSHMGSVRKGSTGSKELMNF